MKNNKIIISTANSKYEILIGSNLINKLDKILKSKLPKSEKYLIVFDSKVPFKMIKKLKQKIKKKVILYKFSSSEKNKDQHNVNKLLTVMQKYNFNRNDSLIAVGGGVVGDVSGFAASIFKRGLKLSLIHI